MKIITLMKKLLLNCFIAASVLAFNACSDKDDPEPDQEGKTAKFTVSVDQVNEDDIMIVDFTGVGPDVVGETIWKVNGEELANQLSVTLKAEDFTSNKTFTIESTRPIYAMAATINIINHDEPLKFSYKAEINGKEIKNDTQTIAGEGKEYAVQYQY